MVADHTVPWEPPSRRARALILVLVSAVVLLLAWRLSAVRPAPPTAEERISAQGRLMELQQAIASLAENNLKLPLPRRSIKPGDAGPVTPWDRALMAVLAAESGELDAAKTLLARGPEGPAGAAFQRCFHAAYLADDSAPEPSDLAAVRQALRNGYAARLLEARLETVKDPANALRLRTEAGAWALPRLAGLAAAGLAILLLIPSGIAMALVLLLAPRRPPRFPPPAFTLSGEVLAIVFLAWFLAFLLSGQMVAALAGLVPAVRPFALPLTYGLHATVGLGLLCRAENLAPGALARRLMPGSHLRSLAWGLGFLALAAVMVLAVALVMSRFVDPAEPPQRELMDLVAGAPDLLSTLTLFFTVALLAPLFEECLFRGTLLPWLGHRLEPRLGRRSAWVSALLLTSLAFGLIHLQPAALPVLSTLGMALGLAFLRTGNLLSAVALHGLWNGGVFLFYRTVLG